MPSPGLLSPRLGPGSDASSVRSSVSPSLGHSRFVDPALLSPNPESVPLRYAGGSPDPPDRDFRIDTHNERHAIGEGATLRGRLARRGEQHKPPDLPIESSGRVLSFERLSIQDETSTEQSYGVSPYYPYSAPHDSQPEFRLRADELSLTSNSSTDGSSIYPCSTPASFGPSGVGNFHDGFEGSSSDAGSSRSHSHSHLPVFDPDHLAVSHNSDDRRQVARAYRRRQLSPYPAAGPSTGQEEGGNTAYWTAGSPGGASTDAFPDHGLHLLNTQDLHTLSPTAADADGSSGGNTDQSSQRDSGHASGYRHSVATDATRRAANARRKDPTKIGAHICPYCGNDFTALHNLNYHIKSHLSLKEHPCKDCGQRFGTPQVLKRHKSKCSPASFVKKKRATRSLKVESW
ncbi:hypothetical protein MVEN_02135600 [Mycena venus]|uniref:C2H2-type domain-containing protein n=1 Tax=Mycena venus TaxID=2733690 RepID=A0A8H6XAI6_9AGAR|nr:hypothetical protein MVEN_02135600 [Mycena venus]